MQKTCQTVSTRADAQGHQSMYLQHVGIRDGAKLEHINKCLGLTAFYSAWDMKLLPADGL